MDVGCTGATDVPWHTVWKPPQPPSRVPQPSLRLSLHVRHEQHRLFNHTEKKKTGDKKTPLSGAHGLSMCVHVQKKERFVLKRERDFKCFSVYSSLTCRDFSKWVWQLIFSLKSVNTVLWYFQKWLCLFKHPLQPSIATFGSTNGVTCQFGAELCVWLAVWLELDWCSGKL